MESWFFALLAALSLPALVTVWRNRFTGPHAELYRRSQLTWVGAGLTYAAQALGRYGYLLLVPAVALLVIGWVNSTRLIRIQNQEALERWRAKGSPPPLPKYDGTD